MAGFAGFETHREGRRVPGAAALVGRILQLCSLSAVSVATAAEGASTLASSPLPSPLSSTNYDDNGSEENTVLIYARFAAAAAATTAVFNFDSKTRGGDIGDESCARGGGHACSTE